MNTNEDSMKRSFSVSLLGLLGSMAFLTTYLFQTSTTGMGSVQALAVQPWIKQVLSKSAPAEYP